MSVVIASKKGYVLKSMFGEYMTCGVDEGHVFHIDLMPANLIPEGRLCFFHDEETAGNEALAWNKNTGRAARKVQVIPVRVDTIVEDEK